MTNLTLAQLSMLSLYSAMGVLALAMIGYTLYLAGLMPAASAPKSERELVTVGAAQSRHPDEPQSGSTRGAASASAGMRQPAEDEIPRRARKAAGMARSLAILGTVLLILAVGLRGAQVSRAPLGNMFEFAITGAMFVMVAFVGWSFRRDLRWLGVFVVAPVLLTLGLAITVWYTDAKELMPSLKSYWLIIHVSVATLAVALCGIGAILAALYLWQSRIESAGTVSFLNRLPASRQLEKLTYSVHIVAFPLWTFTVIAGAIWARQAWGSYWNWDPKEVWSFVIWVVYAAYLHARVTSGWRTQSATWIALAGFGCIILNYTLVNMAFVGQHSYSGL